MNNLHRHDLAFISAGISGPNILDHENELRPSTGDDGSVARVQRVRHVVHLWQPKVYARLCFQYSFSLDKWGLKGMGVVNMLTL